jgi:hypothetical protein
MANLNKSENDGSLFQFSLKILQFPNYGVSVGTYYFSPFAGKCGSEEHAVLLKYLCFCTGLWSRGRHFRIASRDRSKTTADSHISAYFHVGLPEK